MVNGEDMQANSHDGYVLSDPAGANPDRSRPAPRQNRVLRGAGATEPTRMTGPTNQVPGLARELRRPTVSRLLPPAGQKSITGALGYLAASSESCEESVVVGVRSDPKPCNVITLEEPNSTVFKGEAN